MQVSTSKTFWILFPVHFLLQAENLGLWGVRMACTGRASLSSSRASRAYMSVYEPARPATSTRAYSLLVYALEGVPCYRGSCYAGVL